MALRDRLWWAESRKLRVNAYRRCFQGEGQEATRAGMIVIADLDRFCYARKTTYEGNAEQALIAEGRRQVFLRIEGLLALTHEKIERAADYLASLEEEE